MITYFGTGSNRTEEVVGGESSGNPTFDRLQAATSKAIAKLGAEGWDVVGNENINLGFSREPSSGLMFKRRR